MDLALHVGSTAGGLAAAMPEAEFVAWREYAAKRMLPHRRMEMYLAQIALLIARTMGGAKDVTIQDFLFDPQEPEDSDADPAQAAREFFDFRPLNRPAAGEGEA